MHKIDPQKIRDQKKLDEARNLAKFLIEARGTRGTALLLNWTLADVSRIANARWKEIRLYPEHLEALRLVYEVVSRDTELIVAARELSADLMKQVGEVVRTSSKMRRALRRM